MSTWLKRGYVENDKLRIPAGTVFNLILLAIFSYSKRLNFIRFKAFKKVISLMRLLE